MASSQDTTKVGDHDRPRRLYWFPFEECPCIMGEDRDLDRASMIFKTKIEAGEFPFEDGEGSGVVEHNILVEVAVDELAKTESAELLTLWLEADPGSETRSNLSEAVGSLITRSLRRVKSWETVRKSENNQEITILNK